MSTGKMSSLSEDEQFFNKMRDLLDAKPLSEEPYSGASLVQEIKDELAEEARLIIEKKTHDPLNSGSPSITEAYQIQVMAAGNGMGRIIGMDFGTEFHPSEPNKRAKIKAARKQRRQQK